MASMADVIILSSSPNPPRSPGPGGRDAEPVSHALPRGSTPPPIRSTSDLSKPHTRSRFFPTPVASSKCLDGTTKSKKRLTNKDPPSEATEQTAPSKPRRKTKKVADAPGTIAFGNPQPEAVGTKNDAVKPTKSRSRSNAKSKDSGNMTLAGKVTKTSRDLPTKKSSKDGKKTVATKLSPSEDTSEKSTPKESNTLGKDEVLHLDEAMRRRMDWTPPRETAYEQIATVADRGSQDKDRDLKFMGGFGKLVSDYNYSGSALNPRDLVQNANGEGPTKRRRIELVNPEIQALLSGRRADSSDQSSGQEEKPEKPKKTTKGKPKKFTTLTARMTAQYSANDAEVDEPLIDRLPGISTTKRRQRKAKETEKQSSSTILSPEAAVEFLNDQDLIFGSCSQLEKDDSPQTLRETQQAIHASEGLSYPTRTHNNDPSVLQESSTRFVSKLTGTRNLWCVGARDTEGSLIQPETLNVVDLTNGGESPGKKSQDNVENPSHKPLQSDWYELEFADIDSPSEKRPSSLPAERGWDSDTQAQAPVPTPAATATATAMVKAAKPAKEINNTPTEALDSRPASSQPPSMPQYTGFTDAELSKQISSYGFKAVRGRKKMIDLLQRCWESKYGKGSNTTSASHPRNQPEQQKEPASKMDKVSKSTSAVKTKATTKSKPGASTKNRRSLDATKSTSTSRINLQASPKKTSRKATAGTSASFIDVEEIQDSEEEIIPSPSQVQKHYTDIYSNPRTGTRLPHNSLDILTKTPSPSPTKLKVGSSGIPSKRPPSSASIPTTHIAESSEEISLADISAQITQAVRLQPRLSPLSSSRGSRGRPTWNEKILMYDPIVLEDFTAWLNIEGLGLVGEDREVGAASVREWCESKGICCCWKKNASW